MIRSRLQESHTARVNHPIAESSNIHREPASVAMSASQIPRQDHDNNVEYNDKSLRRAQGQWASLFKNQKQRDTQRNDRNIVLTNQNQQMNTHWGDPLGEKGENVTRIYSLNLNGIALDRRGGQFDSLCSIAKELQIDILCGQEHNVDTSQSEVRSILHQTARQHWGRFRLGTGSTPTQFTNWYKPGGTLQLSIGNITGQITGTDQDPLGRWVCQTFRGKEGFLLTVISAYQVVETKPKGGTTTAASQQVSLLTQANVEDRDPRNAFKRDLRSYLTKCKQRGHEILLLGDFNESIDGNFNGMSKLVADFHLVDLMRGRSNQAFPATYSRGRLRLDYGLATKRVADALVAAGYEPFNERFPTDHRAYYFDLETEKLFGLQTQVLANAPLRMMHATNAKQVTYYLKEKYSQLEQCNAFARGFRLSMLGNRHSFAERLDRDLVHASLTAEKRVKKFQAPAWSVALARARERVRILKKGLFQMKHDIDPSDTIRFAKDLKIFQQDLELLAITQWSSSLRKARRDVKELVVESFAKRETELQEQISFYEQSSKESDKKKAAILKRIARAEALKKLAEKIRRLRSPDLRQGITRIEIPVHASDDPKSCTEWQIIDVPSEIVENLQNRNRIHFGQAKGTPFTVSPLVDCLGFSRGLVYSIVG